MTRQILILIILTFGLSCNSGRQENNVGLSVTDSDKTQEKVKENIRLDFTAERINALKKTIEIKASLFNDNTDTVYFLSSSCDGEQYSLRYDTTKFVLTPFMNCNVSYPRLLKIAPKGKYDFRAYLGFNSKETIIKLGFDFYSVNKSFDLTNKKLREINIFNRPTNKQTIIWSVEKIIK